MQIISKKVKDLVPYAKNAKKHEQRQIDGVARSIEQFGFVQPVVVDKNNEIVIGHCRVLAAKKLKMKEVPCVCVDDLTDEQVKALRLADNKLNESEWDFALIDEELATISEIDMTDLGFTIDDMEDPIEVIDEDDMSVSGINKKLCKCPVCGHINEEKAFKCYEDTE